MRETVPMDARDVLTLWERTTGVALRPEWREQFLATAEAEFLAEFGEDLLTAAGEQLLRQRGELRLQARLVIAQARSNVAARRAPTTPTPRTALGPAGRLDRSDTGGRGGIRPRGASAVGAN